MNGFAGSLPLYRVAQGLGNLHALQEWKAT
jgi:hypothetical protein